MLELWNTSDSWRIAINVLGGISIVVALYLLYISYKMIANYFIGKKTRELKNIYAKLYELPGVFIRGEIQLGFEIPENIHVKFSVLDRDEKEVLIIHEGDLKAGSHVYLFNSKDMKNGDYFLNFVSEYQSINKKMIIQN
tara:strand:+ start:1573 stop:1989 length:417 start_codon:yes stop_codon:yes gene_type:complete